MAGACQVLSSASTAGCAAAGVAVGIDSSSMAESSCNGSCLRESAGVAVVAGDQFNLLERIRNNKNNNNNNSSSSSSSSCQGIMLPHAPRSKLLLQQQPLEFSNNKQLQSLAFVYGTLKQGFSNHWLMEEVMAKGHARFVGVASTKKKYPLVCGPFQVPFLLDMPACGYRVRGELYEVDRVAVERLDELEGVSKGHYVRRPLTLTGLQSLQYYNYDPSAEIQAEAYFAAAPLTQGLAQSAAAHIEAYTKKQTVNYVPRKDRPQNQTFLEHVNAWIESHQAAQSVKALEVCSR